MIRIYEVLTAVFMAVQCAHAATPPGAAPTLEQLANMTYKGIYEHAITLTNGRWEGKPFVAGRPAVSALSLRSPWPACVMTNPSISARP